MIKLIDDRGEEFWLNIDLIEVIFKRRGDTSEIKLTNGHIYTCVESPKSIGNRIQLMRMQMKPLGVSST